jgi:hypothetical protein
MAHHDNFRLTTQLTLCCPHCEEPWTHHGKVTVYNRIEEDGPVTQVHVFPVGKVLELASAEGNPSGRRDGIAILFRCELGCPDFELTIEQHKGQSVISRREPVTYISDPPMLRGRKVDESC